LPLTPLGKLTAFRPRPDPLAGFQGPFRSRVGRGERGKEGRGGKGKGVRKGKEGKGEGRERRNERKRKGRKKEKGNGGTGSGAFPTSVFTI